MGGKRIEVLPHKTVDEVVQIMNACSNVTEFRNWQIISLAIDKELNLSLNKIAETLRITYDWVRKVIHRYNEDPENGLKDKRKETKGQPPLLSEKEQEELFAVLQKKAPDGGLWSGPKVNKWIEKKTGKKTGHSTGWTYLQKLGFALIKPRPCNKQAATKEEQEEFKKKSQRESQTNSKRKSRKKS